MEMNGRGPARLHRSALYVPGHIPDWMPDAARSGTDLLILDLEDSDPVAEKERARAVGYQWTRDGTETHHLRSRANR